MFACIHALHSEGEAHAVLLDSASIFSPRVEDTAPDTVVFDLEGLERLWGSYEQIAKQVYEQVLGRGIQANIAVASNPDAAISAARGFQGITILNRRSEAKQLEGLPLEVLSLSPEILETIDRWGIRTFGAFAKLPAIQVSERLGQDGIRIHNLARGMGSRPLVPYREQLRFKESMELDHEIDTLEPLTFILSRLLDQICSRLRIHNFATHEIHLALNDYIRVLRLPLPVRNSKLLTKLFILDLESHPPVAAITKVIVEAIPAKPRIVQNGLFVPLSPEPEKLEVTLARIAAVVGAENIGSPEVLDTHRPDAFRMRRFGIQGNERGLKPATAYPLSCFGKHVVVGFSLHSIALRLFRPPLEATVQVRNENPVWIAFHGVHGRINIARGPWHTSGDWWRTNTWDREEWDIEVLETLYRIYYDVHLDRWFAQGVYD